MEIYKYVNSKDIGEYLKQIGYEFNALEAAWIIYASKNMSYEEKKEKWKEIVSELPDCEVPKRNNCAGWSSLHLFLQRYMDAMDQEIKEFYTENTDGRYVYTYSYLYKNDTGWSGEYEDIYSSLSKCMDAYKNSAEELDDTFSQGETGVLKYCLKRQALDDPEDVMEIEYRGDGGISRILLNTKRSQELDEILEYFFMGMWFDFPTPFKKGDIVWVPADDQDIKWDCDGGFVLERLSTWEVEDWVKESGDNSDMNGYGYFVNPDGTVYREAMWNYMDLEFYRGPYKRNEKILPALSLFIKGEIGVDLLLCAYRKVLLDVAVDDVMLTSWYSADIIKKIGLME